MRGYRPMFMRQSQESIKNVRWNRNELISVMRAQRAVNELLLSPNFTMTQEAKQIIDDLRKDIVELGSSKCSVCGDIQSVFIHELGIEHITMNTVWGYESTHDMEEHELILCNKCYDEYILNGPLGKFVKVVRH